MKGLYEKYILHKADGSPIEPEARYFVLRYDNDVDALYAAMMWAALKENWELVEDLKKEARFVNNREGQRIGDSNEDFGSTASAQELLSDG